MDLTLFIMQALDHARVFLLKLDRAALLLSEDTINQEEMLLL